MMATELGPQGRGHRTCKSKQPAHETRMPLLHSQVGLGRRKARNRDAKR